MKEIDVAIVGGGPAGVGAALYSARYGLKVVVFEKGLIGGQINSTNEIENYPGYSEIKGMELAQKFKEQIESQGAKIENEEVLSFCEENNKIKIKTTAGDFISKTLIFAAGSNPKKLNISGEAEFENKGVHYCALCDGAMYKGKDVAVIGGGDSALKEAITLSKIVNKVYIIHRRDKFRSVDKWAKKIKEIKNIKTVMDVTIKEFKGSKFLEKIILIDNKTKKERELNVSASFTYVGYTPQTKNFNFKKDEAGFIIVDKNLETSIRNVFAAGDCVKGNLAQIITSTSSGVLAATKAFARINGEI